ANTLGAGEINTASLGAVNAWVGTLTVGDTAITESDQEDFGSVTLTIGGTTSAIFTQTVDIDGPTTRADVRLSFAMGAFSGSPTWTVTIESPTGTVRKSVSGNTKQEFMTVPSEITLASGPRNLTYRFSITGATGSVTFNARQGFVGQFKR
ncbi:MAG: hypothetical protein H5U20_04080, partial [Rhodobacteraceae bacterium]|nr:hypothetical protein [Paracoccaceae bacterium]